MAKIYHYTTIDALALILKNKSILFNRQDNVDDLEEGSIKPMNIKLATYTFISCWTENEEENIPLWKMYTDNGVGVRIGLEMDMFKDYTTTSCGYKDACLTGSLVSKLPIEEMINSNYVITLFTKSEQIYRKIEYVQDFVEKTNSLVKMENLRNKEKKLFIDSNNIGRYKPKRWSFEEESRFVLNIWPCINNRSLFDTGDLIYKSLVDGKELSFKHYFLYLKDDIFDDLEIRMSPHIPESKKIMVEALRDKYAPKAIIQDSALNNFVKLK